MIISQDGTHIPEHMASFSSNEFYHYRYRDFDFETTGSCLDDNMDCENKYNRHRVFTNKRRAKVYLKQALTNPHPDDKDWPNRKGRWDFEDEPMVMRDEVPNLWRDSILVRGYDVGKRDYTFVFPINTSA